ncbi:hypothetical protein WMF26_26680 [Sorangium sp. So ce185]|uniref:hypothetical protein n=1 Tax=Sorangium sp. So ce185 TaxID=3133287 RepID=UPI003F5D6D46
MATSVVFGSVRQSDGGMLNPGSGGWSSTKVSTGRYKITFNATSSQAPIVVVTPVDDAGRQSADNQFSTYNHEHSPPAVYVCSVDKASGALEDANFSFVAYVVQS